METSLQDNLKILDIVKINNSDTTGNSYTSSNTTHNENNRIFSDGPMSTMTNTNLPTYPTTTAANVTSNIGTYSSPASFLTNAGSPAVLGLSGITATNLLITSSGALGISQIANLTATANSTLINSINGNNSSIGVLNTGSIGAIVDTNLGILTNPEVAPSISGLNTSIQQPINPSNNQNAKSTETFRSAIRPVDFCYSDDQNIRFSIVDAINLCVTVVAYATHAYRANQMLIILDVIMPRYLAHIREETEKIMNIHRSSFIPNASLMDKANQHYHQEVIQQARMELAIMQKLSISIKTLVNTSDFLTRTYSGPRVENTNVTKSNINNNKSSVNRSPSIMPDEDSMRLGLNGKIVIFYN